MKNVDVMVTNRSLWIDVTPKYKREVERYLHNQPGVNWVHTTKTGFYVTMSRLVEKQDIEAMKAEIEEICK